MAFRHSMYGIDIESVESGSVRIGVGGFERAISLSREQAADLATFLRLVVVQDPKLLRESERRIVKIVNEALKEAK